MNAHVASKGADVFCKYGPKIGLPELKAILEDTTVVRYPCELVFDSRPLQSGEFAFPEPRGDKPDDGFTMYVHPYFSVRPKDVPLLVLYQIVVVNYGDFASADDAETFAAHALGMDKEAYYTALCAMADEISGEDCL